jgi:hypothetical protein
MTGRPRVAIQSFSTLTIDTSAWQSVMLLGCERKVNRQTGELLTDKDGVPKWRVQVIVKAPDRWEPDRLANYGIDVGITSDEDPAEGIPEGSQVVFLPRLEVGTSPTEIRKEKATGGQFYYQAGRMAPAGVPVGKS